MQIAITFMAVLAGMVVSLTVALFAEELIFGQVIRWFFVRTGSVQTASPEQMVKVGTEPKR